MNQLSFLYFKPFLSLLWCNINFGLNQICFEKLMLATQVFDCREAILFDLSIDFTTQYLSRFFE